MSDTDSKANNKGSDRSNKIRKRIQEQVERQEQEHKREMMRRRLEIARTGVKLYESKKFSEAVSNFKTYLKIVEEWKGVSEGGLSPKVFDVKAELPELILISGIYWDLVKLYDRTNSGDRKKDFNHYMEKYVTFSRGMPFQMLCAETIRKYISNEKPKHDKEFKMAYQTLYKGKCFIAGALVGELPFTTYLELVRYRDLTLKKSKKGRLFIRAYYFAGPSIAKALNHSPRIVRKTLAVFIERSFRYVQGENKTVLH